MVSAFKIHKRRHKFNDGEQSGINRNDFDFVRMRHTRSKPYENPYSPGSLVRSILLATGVNKKKLSRLGLFSESCDYEDT